MHSILESRTQIGSQYQISEWLIKSFTSNNSNELNLNYKPLERNLEVF